MNAVQQIKDAVKRTPLGSFLLPRRIHVYGVGAAKTGTKSIASLFGMYRSRHEPRHAETIELIEKVEGGHLARAGVESVLRKRDRELRLEVEVSQLLVHFLPWLVEMFPQAQFILMVREPRSWLRSIIDQNINHGFSTTIPDDSRPSWRRYGIIKYGEEPGGPYPPEEQALEDYGLYTIDAFLSNWAWHNKTVLNTIPSERLMTIRTSDISQSIENISEFVGVDMRKINDKKSHVHKAPKRHGVLEEIDESYLEDKIEEKCTDVIEKIEEETSISLR